MDRGLDWYKREPQAFLDGVQGMGPEMIGAYAVIIDLLYARAGKTPRDDRHLSGILGCSIRKARALTDALIERGKIQVQDGFITNSRAFQVSKSKRNLSEIRAKAGRKGGENRSKNSKNNDLGEANALSKTQADKRKRREEEKEEAYASSKKKRGTRIKDDWVLPKDWGEWALAEGWPEHAIRLEAQKFHDHWKAAPGQKGVKLDWQATWRNWMRNSKSRKNQRFGENDPTTTDPTLDAIAIAARMRRTSR